MDKLFCDFAFPKIKLNQLTEDVASLSTKVEEAINVAGGLQSLPLDENGNRLAKILVGGEEIPVIIGTNDKLNEVDWEQLPGYSGSGVEEALPIFIKELSADLNSFVTQFKSVGTIEFLSDGKSLILKSSTGEELGKIIDGKLNITSEQIIKIPKGSRPNPVLYMTASEIAGHLKLFDDYGGGFLFTLEDISNPTYQTFNPNKYIMLKPDLEDLIKQFNSTGDVSILEKGLGYEAGDLKGKEIYVKYIDKPEVSIPSGNEGGANEFWSPKGFTSGGKRESVLSNDALYKDKSLSNPIYHGNDIKNLKNTFKLN